MKIYAIILAAAVVALAAIVYAGSVFLPGYSQTSDFYKAIYVESLSFVTTTAVVGSLSAAVVRYIEERRSKPLRNHAAGQIESALRVALEKYIKFLHYGNKKSLGGFGGPYVASLHAKAHRYHRSAFHLADTAFASAVKSLHTVIDAIDKHSAVFPVDQQDDLAELNEVLKGAKRRLMIGSTKFGEHQDGYEIPNSGVTDQWNRALAHLQGSIGRYKPKVRGFEFYTLPSSRAISQNAEILAKDTKLIAASLIYTTDKEIEDENQSPWKIDRMLEGMIQLWGIAVDFDEPADDEEAEIVARVPSAVMGIRGENVLNLDSVIRAMNYQDKEQAANLLAWIMVYRMEKGLASISLSRWEKMIGIDMTTWKPKRAGGDA